MDGNGQIPKRFVRSRSLRSTVCQKGSAVERRQSKRNQIEVDIEIAHPGSQHCYGFARNISRTGVSVHVCQGRLPQGQRSVILNFKVWTGSETLYRKIYARVVRTGEQAIALEFAEHDFIAEAVIQDLMFYQKRERYERVRRCSGPVEPDRDAIGSAGPAL